jgi:hypothetical protein
MNNNRALPCPVCVCYPLSFQSCDSNVVVVLTFTCHAYLSSCLICTYEFVDVNTNVCPRLRAEYGLLLAGGDMGDGRECCAT